MKRILIIIAATLILLLMSATAIFPAYKNQIHLLSVLSWVLLIWFAAMEILKHKLSIGLDFAVELIFSVFYATILFVLWPTSLAWDDAGIVLKYMDNFRDGFFFCYNPQDGPVFGISSAVHGILAGFFAWTRLFGPENSVFASNFIGIVLMSFATFKILKVFITDHLILFLFWALLMVGSKWYLINSRMGLETPLHISIILFTVYFLSVKKDTWFFLFSALSIISKLDSTPIIGLLMLYYLLDNIHGFKLISFRNPIYKTIIYYGLTPLLIWTLFTFVVFGSPLPQSAYAKYFYRVHPQGHWFPFLELYIQTPSDKLFITVFLVLFAINIYQILLDKNAKASILPGVSFLAVLILYYVCNFSERMSWYYALPHYLMRLQIAISVVVIFKDTILKYTLLLTYGAFIVFAFFISPEIIGAMNDAFNWINIAERERVEIGKYINEKSAVSDKVFSGHGYIAYHSKRYVIDYSGLNSKRVTELNMDWGKLLDEYKPEWIVQHGLLASEFINKYGYKLEKSFYDITSIGFTTWRVFRKTGVSESQFVSFDRQGISTNGSIDVNPGFIKVHGTKITFDISGMREPKCFCFGLAKTGSKIDIKLTLQNNDKKIEKLVSVDPLAPDEGRTKSIALNFEGDVIRQITIESVTSDNLISVLDPVVETGF